MLKPTTLKPHVLENVPESFSEATRILFRQLAECARLYKKSRNNHETVQDILYQIAGYIEKIEKKFGLKLTAEEQGIFQTMKTVISEKLVKIVEGKPVSWGDGEAILHICLDIGNRIDQENSVSEITDKVRGRIVQNSSGKYII